jgi:hypothetical protein
MYIMMKGLRKWATTILMRNVAIIQIRWTEKDINLFEEDWYFIILRKLPCTILNLKDLANKNVIPIKFLAGELEKIAVKGKRIGGKGHSCCLCTNNNKHFNFYCLNCSISFQFPFALCDLCKYKDHHEIDDSYSRKKGKNNTKGGIVG